MEQFFIVLAVLAVWIFRGVAGASRRSPGEGGGEGSLGPGGSIDVTARTRQRSLEAQQRAIEALQRWEAKQGLAPRDPQERESPGPAPSVVATERTRTARPAQFSRRTTAERKRQDAYAEISRMLDPVQSGRRSSAERRGFEVPRTVDPAPEVAPVQPRVVSLEDPEQLAALAARRERSSSPEAAPGVSSPGGRPKVTRLGKPKQGGGGRRATARAVLPRLEGLPLAARAMVYAELLGPPKSIR
jgi:hypothetical protein